MQKASLASLSVIGLSISTPTLSDPPGSPVPSSLEQARTLLGEGKPDAALTLVDLIVAKAELEDAKDPNAMCPSAAGAFLAAFMKRSNLNVTVTVENDWCEAMLVQGYALAELKRYDEAVARLGKLVQHDSRNANYLGEYAFALRSNGKIDQASEIYTRMKDAASHYSDKAAKRHWRAVALRGIGFIHFDRLQWDKAEKSYRDSLKDEPDNKIALSELELIRQRRSQ